MATDAATASATDPTDGIVRGNAARMQAYRLREVAFRFALDVAGVTVQNPSDELCARARDFAACVKAWSEADERGRIARGRPLPGSLRPERKSRPKRAPTIAPIIPREQSNALTPSAPSNAMAPSPLHPSSESLHPSSTSPAPSAVTPDQLGPQPDTGPAK